MADTLATPPGDRASGIEIGLRTPFDSLPAGGACTVEVTIRNGSRRDGRWDLTLGPRGNFGWTYRTRQTATVTAGASATFLVVSLMGGQMYAPVELTVRGPGVRPEPVTACQVSTRPWTSRGTSYSAVSRPIATSRSLAGSNANLTKEALAAQGRSLEVSTFAPADLPADARSYSAFALLGMRQAEWQGLRADVREAIQDWAALGGELWFVGTSSSEVAHGFGRVVTVAGQGDETWNAFVARAFTGVSWETVTGDSPYQPWSLPGLLAEPEVPRWSLFGLLLVCSALIGPLNLYLFARGRLRHRVYWTTPLIAAASALALVVMILSRDGMGGAGHRFTAIAVLPDAHRAAVIQEQVARTGLLFDTSFENPDPLRVRPLLLERDVHRFVGAGIALEQAGQAYSGWFGSRRRQAQYIETLRPTRARVQVRRGQSREALSSIDGTLTRLVVITADGSAWDASGVGTGVPAPLRPFEGYDRWLDATLEACGPSARERVLALAKRPGYFFATVEGTAGAIETLPSIRWEQHGLLYLGPIEEMP